jgi:hypothetical protein
MGALVANRLTSPAPLVRVEDWARNPADPVEEVFGVPADALNDDRIGRALDALADQAEAVVGSVGARAVAAFGLDVSRIHWDLTSISLFGAYPEADGDYATPRYGHSCAGAPLVTARIRERSCCRARGRHRGLLGSGTRRRTGDRVCFHCCGRVRRGA